MKVHQFAVCWIREFKASCGSYTIKGRKVYNSEQLALKKAVWLRNNPTYDFREEEDDLPILGTIIKVWIKERYVDFGKWTEVK